MTNIDEGAIWPANWPENKRLSNQSNMAENSFEQQGGQNGSNGQKVQNWAEMIEKDPIWPEMTKNWLSSVLFIIVNDQKSFMITVGQIWPK